MGLQDLTGASLRLGLLFVRVRPNRRRLRLPWVLRNDSGHDMPLPIDDLDRLDDRQPATLHPDRVSVFQLSAWGLGESASALSAWEEDSKSEPSSQSATAGAWIIMAVPASLQCSFVLETSRPTSAPSRLKTGHPDSPGQNRPAGASTMETEATAKTVVVQTGRSSEDATMSRSPGSTTSSASGLQCLMCREVRQTRKSCGVKTPPSLGTRHSVRPSLRPLSCNALGSWQCEAER